MKDLIDTIVNWKNLAAVIITIIAGYIIRVNDAAPLFILFIISLSAVYGTASLAPLVFNRTPSSEASATEVADTTPSPVVAPIASSKGSKSRSKQKASPTKKA